MCVGTCWSVSVCVGMWWYLCFGECVFVCWGVLVCVRVCVGVCYYV